MSRGIVANPDFPANRARLRVQSDEVAVERPDIQRVVKNCNAAICRAEAQSSNKHRKVSLPRPQRASGSQVERCDPGWRLGHVHHSVYNERRRLEPGARADLIDPKRLQSRNVCWGDLVERRKTMRGVV